MLRLQPSGTRDLLLDRPIRLWVLFLVAVTAMGVIAKSLAPHLLSGPAGVSPLQVALQVAMGLMVLPFALRFDRTWLGLVPFPLRASLAVLLFPVMTVIYGYLAGFRELPLPTLILAFVSVALAGVIEELAFRGVLLSILLPKGLWRAVIVTSALFGLMHLSNLALGSPWYSVLLQVTFATMAGTGYAAMRIRTGSLWPPIILHAAFDLTFRVAAVEVGSMFANSIHMLHGVGWLVYALVVLRRGRARRSRGRVGRRPSDGR